MARLAEITVSGRLMTALASGSLAVSAIDGQDRTFCIRHELHHPKLRSSIAREGVLMPLWVRRRAETFALVHGFRRWAAASAEGLEELPCLVLPDDAPERVLWRMLLFEKADTSLDLFERAAFLSKLLALPDLARSDIARDWAPALGLPKDPSRWQEILRVLAMPALSRSRSLELGIAPRALLLYASRWSGEDESFFYERYLSRLPFNTNELAEALEAFEALRRRENVRLLELARRFEPAPEDGGGKAAIATLLEALGKALAPRVWQAREALRRAQAGFPKGISLAFPPSFESSGVRLSLELESRESWVRQQAWLASHGTEIERIFDVLP